MRSETDLLVYAVMGAVALLAIVAYVLLIAKPGNRPGLVPHPFLPDETVRILPPGEYDAMRAKVMADAVAALCQSPDFKPARLVVADFDLPVAYAWMSPWVRKKYRNTANAGSNDPAVIVTPAFLNMGLTDQELEAVAADVLAKLFFNPDHNIRFADVTHFAKKMGFTDDFIAQMKSEFPLDYMVLMTRLIQDVYAARLITQPQALKTAMEKSLHVLNQTSFQGEFAGMMSFVDPPLMCSLSRAEMMKMSDDLKVRHALAMNRDRLNELRLTNLGVIEQGVRQPHMEVRDTRPMTTPEGWE